MSQTAVEQVQPVRHKRKNAKKIIALASILILVIAAIGGSYYLGYKNGEKQGFTQAKKDLAANPFTNLADSNKFLPQYKTGEVASITKDTVVINVSNGKQEKFTVNSKTKVTRKTETLSLSNLKKGDKVTVFVTNDGTVTRIVLKSN